MQRFFWLNLSNFAAEIIEKEGRKEERKKERLSTVCTLVISLTQVVMSRVVVLPVERRLLLNLT